MHRWKLWLSCLYEVLLLHLIIVCYNEQSWERHANRTIVGPSFLLA